MNALEDGIRAAAAIAGDFDENSDSRTRYAQYLDARYTEYVETEIISTDWSGVGQTRRSGGSGTLAAALCRPRARELRNNGYWLPLEMRSSTESAGRGIGRLIIESEVSGSLVRLGSDVVPSARSSTRRQLQSSRA